MTIPGEPKKESKGCGCFMWGCLTIIVILILCIVGIYFWLKGLVEEYTTETPLPLPEVQGTDDQYEQVKARFQQFKDGIEGRGALQPLVLTDQDINLYITRDPDLKDASDKIRVKIEGSQIGGQINIPLETLGFPGRFVNGEGTFRVSFENGKPFFGLDSLSVNGKPIPSAVLDEVRKQNIAEEMFKEEKNREWMKYVESVTVKDGKLTVVGKKQGS